MRRLVLLFVVLLTFTASAYDGEDKQKRYSVDERVFGGVTYYMVTNNTDRELFCDVYSGRKVVDSFSLLPEYTTIWLVKPANLKVRCFRGRKLI